MVSRKLDKNVGKVEGEEYRRLSNEEREGTLNSPEIKARGKFCQPTINLLVAMILRQVGRLCCGWKGVVSLKICLKGAFRLMHMLMKSVSLLAMVPLVSGVSMV